MSKIIKVGVDAGNNALKLWVEGEDPVMVPSTYALHFGNATEQFEQADIPIDELLDNIDVTINSKALKHNNLRYYVGETVLGNQIKGNEFEKLSDKSTDEIPVILTLSALAVEAIKRNPTTDMIKMSFDLSVALPVATITQDKAIAHSKRLMGAHEVVYHHPSGRNVTVEVNVEFCKCIPEGAAAAWGVVFDEKGNLSSRQVETNDKLKTINFSDKLLLHIDIGAGTTEIVVTDGVQYKPRMSEGLNYGTKDTINEIIKRWNKEYPRKSINGISEYNEIYFNSEHPRHIDLLAISKIPLRNLAILLSQAIINKIDDLKDDPYTFIYGGGSIILKSHLEEILKSKDRLTNVVFLGNPMYVNARGLLVFALSPVYDASKDTALATKSGK
ncbi:MULTISPECIES: ParM/StbA family protein [unclassified Sporosarcina]|uniref:ParM/StbA family protein n=1 Tax=unclassified Sporosarcina TaxID=2647733 RepID=UPI001A925129|nr:MULTISPECIES: ParM/StbA family protein [unclassified Sporosarcina]MBO0588210.1 ParM/StbA family protein [Sporosarcina sp. E16_8]MBO0601964.1 ParM/StbA family protein [Sporosarcina sp. E16_3]